MLGQELQRADRIGLLPAERRPFVLGQGFRQDEQAVAPVDQGQARGHPERQARADAAEEAAERGAQHEADAERRPDQAEVLRPLLRRRDVGDVGSGGGEAGRGDARDQAAEEKPGQVRRHGHDDVVHPQAEDGDQQDRPPAEPVRQGADDGRGEELHHRPGGREDQDVVQGLGGRPAGHFLDQVGQHRDDDPERDHVHQGGGEDEAEGGGTGRSAGGHRLRRFDDDLAFGHFGLLIASPCVGANPGSAQCAERTPLKVRADPSALGALICSSCAIRGWMSTLSKAARLLPRWKAGPSAMNSAAICGAAGS